MTVSPPNNTYERIISGSNLFITVATLAVGGMIWNAVNIHDHAYRIDRLEATQADGKKEVLQAVSGVSTDVKSLAASVAEVKTEIAIQHRDDAARDERIKVILDRMEKR